MITRVTESLQNVGRKKHLEELLTEGWSLQGKDEGQLLSLLREHHDIFSLEEAERGETDRAEMNIETDNAIPVRQAPCRIPLTVYQEVTRQEVAHQLQQMQENGAIQSSNSPWASPIVFVCKKDGTMHFYVDYRSYKGRQITTAKI